MIREFLPSKSGPMNSANPIDMILRNENAVVSIKRFSMNWTIYCIKYTYVFSLRPELHICQLVWRDSRTLLIGWGDSVKVNIF